MIGLKQIFTWWNKNTFGTFLKTLFYGKYVGSDQFGNKYYKSKKDERWVIYGKEIEATKLLPTGFFGYIIPLMKYHRRHLKKYSWQKNHIQNLSGTKEAYKPNKISKKIKFKNYETWKN